MRQHITCSWSFALVGLALIVGACGAKPDAPGTATVTTRPVRTVVARTMGFVDSLITSAEITAVRTAQVGARIPGVVDEILVDEGDRVVADDTVLFRTDRLKLEKAVAIAQGNEVVAAAAVAAGQADRDRLQADLNKAVIDHERFTRLFEQDGAVTRDAVENQASRRAQLTAAVQAAAAAVRLAEAQAEQAALGLIMARKDLDDSMVRAALSGVVTERMVEPGEIAGAGTTVLAIEDLSLIEVTARLAEVHYDRVVVGETRVTIRVGAVDLGEHVVAFKSPVVAPGLRTFAVRCRIQDPPPAAVPGRPATLRLVFAAREGLGVSAEAVLPRREGPVLFVLDDGVARSRSVTTGLRADGWIELTDGTLRAGDAVVVEGQDRLDDGETVRVVGKAAE